MPDFFTSITAGSETKTVQDPNAAPLVGKGINLFDNWYFPNPVNQRGQASYIGATNVFDRWKSTANSTITLASDGVTVTKSGSGNAILYQVVAEENRIVNQEMTLSVLVDSLSGTARMDMNGHPFGMSRYLEVGMNSETFTVPNAGYYEGIYSAIDVTGSVKIRAVKLELGSQQTLARQVNGAWILNDPPPNYQQELAKCQRYLTVLKGNTAYIVFGGSLGGGNTRFWPVCPVPIPMRSVTKVEYSGTFVATPTGPTAGAIAVNSMAVESTQTSAVALNVVCASNLTGGQYYNLESDNSVGAYILLSAEL